nr:phosphoribosyltransferase family protein [Flavihumibacter rivuli]
MFRNRIDAAEQLVPRLQAYKGKEGIVLAVPRGAIPMGYVLAKALNMPLDIVLTKKIGYPGNPEYAIGAAGLEDAYMVPHPDVTDNYIRETTEKARVRLKEMNKVFRNDQPLPDLKGKVVIIVDDGLATGSTMMATVRMLKKSQPARLVVAVPVASDSAVAKLQPEVDDLVCLSVPDTFYGVGQFYDDFPQVEDHEVLAWLKKK